MDSMKATCNIYFCDYGTVFVDKNKTWQLLATLVLYAKHLFNRAADIAQSDLVNSRTFKDLWNEIQGLSSTCPVFKYFQGLQFGRKKFKDFQVLSRMHGNPVVHCILHNFLMFNIIDLQYLCISLYTV